jgi:predicted ferric reductase
MWYDILVSNHTFWYLSRTSALAAYILLFISLCLGIGLKTKYLDPLWQRWLSFDLHKFTAILGGSLVILHVFSLLGDSYLSFSVSDLLIPMSSSYRPLWTALGITGFYAGIVLVLSSLIRRRIRQKTWRILHYASFVLFYVILFHAIKSGTDSSNDWVQSLYVATGTVVAFLSLWRFFSYRAENTPKTRNARIVTPVKLEKN